MPNFDQYGKDSWVCQCCGRIYSSISKSAWLEPVPGKKFAGNVCKPCMEKNNIVHDSICGVWRGKKCNCPIAVLKR